MLDYLYLMDDVTGVDSLCEELSPILRVFGIVLLIIRIAVPLLLIIYGALDFAKAVMEKEESKMKEAQKKFMLRAILGAVVFFIIPIVGLVMNLIGGTEFKQCTTCISDPFDAGCKKPGDVDF